MFVADLIEEKSEIPILLAAKNGRGGDNKAAKNGTKTGQNETKTAAGWYVGFSDGPLNTLTKEI